jgi:hypothetical protein
LLNLKPTNRNQENLENISNFLYEQITNKPTGEDTKEMKDKKVMTRFNKYLNRALFAN